MKKYLTMILLLLMVIPAQPVPVTWSWAEPTTGSEVAYYEIELAVDDGSWEPFGTAITPALTSEMPYGSSVVRVRGVDSFGRVGPWSQPSEPFVDHGPPGGCSGLNWTVRK